VPSLRTLFPTKLRPLLRLILGFLIAPIMPGVVIGGVAELFSGPVTGSGALALTLSAYFGYPVALLGGVPLYLLLRWRGFNGWLAYVGGGALLGGLPFLKGSVLLREAGLAATPGKIIENVPFLLLSIVCSMFAAWCFWMIARPDRSVKHSELAPSA